MITLLFTLFTFLLLSSPTWAEHKGTELLKRDGLFYYPSHKEPVNGRVVVRYENGQKHFEGTYKDGRRDGLWIEWWENGQKRGEGTYKDGRADGPWKSWCGNGQKHSQSTYRDDNPDGPWMLWYEDGQKRGEGTYTVSYTHQTLPTNREV